MLKLKEISYKNQLLTVNSGDVSTIFFVSISRLLVD